MVPLTLQPSAKLAPLPRATGSDGNESGLSSCRNTPATARFSGKGSPGLGAQSEAEQEGGAGAEAASVFPEEDEL